MNSRCPGRSHGHCACERDNGQGHKHPFLGLFMAMAERPKRPRTIGEPTPGVPLFHHVKNVPVRHYPTAYPGGFTGFACGFECGG